MDFALDLPKLSLHLGGAGGASTSTQPKFLEPLEPPTYPFTAPAWTLAHKPRAVALLDVYKNHELLTTYTVDQKAVYLIGRNAVVCDIVLSHCSISRLHATIIHHTSGAAYLVDLGSCHGTFVDDVPLRALQPTLLLNGSVLKFGASSRSYTFKSFESRVQIEEMLQARIGLEPEEMELEHNTMMNKALSYRLGFSIPLSHKTIDAEGDDPMALCPPRQIEEPSSAAALIRRTQSEDNTIAAGVGPGPAPLFALTQFDLGRKRSRTQSAGLPTQSGTLLSGGTSANGNHAIDEEGEEDMEDDGRPSSVDIRAVLGGEATPGVILKRVHFTDRSPETIPSYSLSSEDEDEGNAATSERDAMAGAMTCRREDVDFDLTALHAASTVADDVEDVVVEP
ncbi:hypothetical protein P43SY_004482 [Pythium insidiosum]|uniref:FHA domain-containing protein n=1 Tax=Pythium insidiosum TaxID=114742 RepID=A0AAD5Q651_PYTIN|nr:hypothetical protein P43SY_004482 [Pythium insidiosum]